MANSQPTADADGEAVVTVVLPTLNERAYIRDCLDSLLAQEGCHIGELLVVDGGSTDGTREIVAAGPGIVRLVDNPRVTAAAAMNIGIAAARGTVIVRADAHTVYAPDYVETSVRVLTESGAAVVGGPMRPVGTSSFGRAVAAVTSSPLGVGPGRFHYAHAAADVETAYLGVFRRETVLAVGGYDEENLQWAAEDQELNYRIRLAGGRIRLDPRIRSSYFPRQTPRSLWRQYGNYGVCKASTLAKHRTLPYWRPLVPSLMVAAAAFGGVFGFARRRPLVAVAVPAAHLAFAGASSIRMARDPGVAPHRALLAILICHWSYGIGFWRGAVTALSGRRFESRPRGHR